MMRKKIFVICPTEIDHRELSREPFASKFAIHFHTYDDTAFKRMAFADSLTSREFDPQLMHRDLIKQINKLNPDAIVSTLDYPGALWAAIMAEKFQLPGSSIAGVMAHQHKYYSRLLQKQIVPDATPQFWEYHNADSVNATYPFFIKPCKSFLSLGSQQVNSPDQLESALKKASHSKDFLKQFEWFMDRYSSFAHDAPRIIGEAMLKGMQCTLEGFLDSGAATMLGVVDSIMYPGTFSFKRFEYPSRLPETVQKRMGEIAAKLMAASDFNHGFFNIEFMYHPKQDTIGIIEVNPRMAYQFADLYEKVDGMNAYSYLLDLALGRSPRVTQRKGMHDRAVIHVFRSYEDKQVISSPSHDDFNELYRTFPDARYQSFVTPGMRLSDTIQDGQTFRYATVSVGCGQDTNLEEQHEQFATLLPFQFAN